MHTPTRAELAEQARANKRYDDSQKLLRLACDAGDPVACDDIGEPSVRERTTPAWE
jgi:hypothetical protein